jgi:hypothetical protein
MWQQISICSLVGAMPTDTANKLKIANVWAHYCPILKGDGNDDSVTSISIVFLL